jgi:hypothetical protein
MSASNASPRICFMLQSFKPQMRFCDAVARFNKPSFSCLLNREERQRKVPALIVKRLMRKPGVSREEEYPSG